MAARDLIWLPDTGQSRVAVRGQERPRRSHLSMNPRDPFLFDQGSGRRARCMKIRLMIIVLGAMVSTSSLAEVKMCTSADAQRANASDASLPQQQWRWQRLYKSFMRFGHCGNAKNKGIWDAELASAYDGAVQYLLVHQWQTIESLNDLSRGNTSFLSFVISHIDDTFPASDIGIVIQNASLRCPRSTTAICARIAAAAKASP